MIIEFFYTIDRTGACFHAVQILGNEGKLNGDLRVLYTHVMAFVGSINNDLLFKALLN